MQSGSKRKKSSTKGSKGAKKAFKPPRRSSIPGTLTTNGTEKKVLFTGTGTPGAGALALNSTGTIVALNLIQVGSSMFNRIGRRVEMVSVRFNCLLNPLNVTRAAPMDYGRVIIVYDRQTNGAYPALADILQDTDQAGTNTRTQFSGLNMNNRDRFVTIMDIRMHLPFGQDTGGLLTNMFPSDTYAFKALNDEYRKLNKLTTHYKADSSPAVIGDISTGGLYLVSLAGSPAGSEIWEMYDWNVRLKYIDV